jgi:hypothetical protein
MPILETPITLLELVNSHCTHYESMSKAVADLGRGRLAVDAEMHADLEALLLEEGAVQKDLWGLNLYPGKTGDDFIEYTSLINIRPAQSNSSLTLQDPTLRERVAGVVRKWVTDAI